MRSASLIIHDTLIVLRCDSAALELFRAAEQQLIGAALLDLLDDPTIKGLASLRMQLARERESRKALPPVEYLFKRFDGTRFWGRMNTQRLDDPREWESQITYLSEY